MDPCFEINLARKKKSGMMKTQIGLYTCICNGEESYSDVTEYIIYIVKRSVKSLQSVTVSCV